MKKITLIFFCLCLVIASFGQNGTPVDHGSFNMNSIPDHIRNSKAFKRAEWFFQQRAFPNDTLPIVTYSRVVSRETEKIKLKSSTGKSSQLWTSVGPRGLITSNTVYSNWGTLAGRVRAVAVHPTDPLTVYIGAACGGLWKTTDGGETWQDIGHDLASLSFGAIAIDPNNPDIVYAGSGECNLLTDFYTFPGNGLYKSTNGGQSWNLITNGFGSNTHFSDLVVSPFNSDIVFATLGGASVFSGAVLPNGGVWKSTDGGITWNHVLQAQTAFDIAFHPTDPNKVYAAIGGYFSPMAGFYISTDQGDTWNSSNTGLLLPGSGGRMQFDISKSNPNIIYSVIYDFNNDPNQSVTRAYKSVNGGINWTHISQNSNLGGYDGYSWYDQGWYDLCIAVDPVNPSHVLIGNVELHKTTNGAIFSPVRPYGNNVIGSLVHCDYHKLVYAPSDPNYLYIGCDGGIYKSIDKGNSASSKNTGLETLQFYRIKSHPDSSGFIIGGMQDNGSAKTRDGGMSWNFVNAGDGMECFFDNQDRNIIYLANQFGETYKSYNGGNSYTWLWRMNGAWVTPFFMHPTENIIYSANTNIMSSNSGGGTFLVLSPNVSPVNINTMAQSQVDPHLMIFGTGLDLYGWDTTFLVKVSTDEGVTWNDVTANIPGEIRWISRVVTDPVEASTMYVLRTGFSEGNKVWKTTDLGLTWTNISGDLPDLPCSDLFIDPENTQHLYLANDIGVYRTTDGGNSWNFASEGMPHVPTLDFDYVKIDTTRYLRVGTHGRSIYQTILPTICPTGNITFMAQSQVDQFKARYPECNEINGSVTIKGEDITNLDGLEGIIGIRGDLRIDSCAMLTDLSGLLNLANIGGDLMIRNNDILDSLSGLDHIVAASIDNLTIANNPILSVCEVQSICEYLIAPTGTTDIHDNATRCSSPQELEVVCQHVGMENEHASENLVIIPNPSSGLFTICFTLAEQTELSLTVHNDLGQAVTAIAMGLFHPGLHRLTWNAENLPAGVYYCRLQAGNLTESVKIIKMH